MFVKRKFNETQKDFSFNYPYTTANVERRFSFVFFFFPAKLRNALAANSLDKLRQLISMEPYTVM